MAYHGYIPIVKKFLNDRRHRHVSVLEVGLDRGITTIPLIAYMARCHETFSYVGVDVYLQPQLTITLQHIDRSARQSLTLLEKNSLEVLPDLVSKGEKFDVVLLDGDHNYFTVSKELEALTSITHENSIVIIDDYSGRWADKDLWYSSREDYKNVSAATPQTHSEKQGVKTAVDEFVSMNPRWQMSYMMSGEPVVLTRRKLDEVFLAFDSSVS